MLFLSLPHALMSFPSDYTQAAQQGERAESVKKSLPLLSLSLFPCRLLVCRQIYMISSGSVSAGKS